MSVPCLLPDQNLQPRILPPRPVPRHRPVHQRTALPLPDHFQSVQSQSAYLLLPSLPVLSDRSAPHPLLFQFLLLSVLLHLWNLLFPSDPAQAEQTVPPVSEPHSSGTDTPHRSRIKKACKGTVRSENLSDFFYAYHHLWSYFYQFREWLYTVHFYKNKKKYPAREFLPESGGLPYRD